MRGPALLCCASVLALAGCVTPYQAKLPSADRDCAPSLEAVPQIPLPFSTTREQAAAVREAEFADIAQCIAGAEGKAHLALYALDQVVPPAQISISVQLSPGGTFAASAELLDAQFQSLRRYTFDQFVRRSDEYSLHVFLNAGEPVPAFLVLSPDSSQVGKHDVTASASTHTTTVPVGTGMFYFNMGAEAVVSRPLLEGGRLKVVARRQGSAAFSSD